MAMAMAQDIELIWSGSGRIYKSLTFSTELSELGLMRSCTQMKPCAVNMYVMAMILIASLCHSILWLGCGSANPNHASKLGGLERKPAAAFSCTHQHLLLHRCISHACMTALHKNRSSIVIVSQSHSHGHGPWAMGHSP